SALVLDEDASNRVPVAILDEPEVEARRDLPVAQSGALGEQLTPQPLGFADIAARLSGRDRLLELLDAQFRSAQGAGERAQLLLQTLDRPAARGVQAVDLQSHRRALSIPGGALTIAKEENRSHDSGGHHHEPDGRCAIAAGPANQLDS